MGRLPNSSRQSLAPPWSLWRWREGHILHLTWAEGGGSLPFPGVGREGRGLRGYQPLGSTRSQHQKMSKEEILEGVQESKGIPLVSSRMRSMGGHGPGSRWLTQSGHRRCDIHQPHPCGRGAEVRPRGIALPPGWYSVGRAGTVAERGSSRLAPRHCGVPKGENCPLAALLRRPRVGSGHFAGEFLRGGARKVLPS